MNIGFFIDLHINAPHIYGHRISEGEVEETLVRLAEDRPGKDGSRVALGRTLCRKVLAGHRRIRSRTR